ncbi:MAG: hypothetical protein ACI4O7_11970 [Aristaeellaceae bacterium]
MKRNHRCLRVAAVWLMVMALAVPCAALADGESWVCRFDGQTSPGNFCPYCGRAKEEAAVDDGMDIGWQSPWPQVDFTPMGVQLTRLSDDTSRRQARGGPSRDYIGVGAYKPGKMRTSTAWFMEGSYVLTEIDYPSVGHRCVYFDRSYFISVRGVEEVVLDGVSACVNATVTPHYGPGYTFDVFAPDSREMPISSGTRVMVLMEKDGWVFVEWNCALGTVRLWVPEDNVSLD